MQVNQQKPILSLLTGAATGGVSGFMGIGGGVVLVPALSQLLKLPQHMAHGTSLAITVPIALSGAVLHLLYGDISWPLVLEIAAGSILGVFIGAKLMMNISEQTLSRGFGVFLIAVGISMFLRGTVLDMPHQVNIVVLGIAIAVGIGFVAGVISGLLGVSGGTVIVPGMVLLLGVEPHIAAGVSLTVIVLTALVGAIIHQRQGNVELSLALWIAPIAVICAIVAAWATNFVNSSVLTCVFGVLLLVLGFRMLLGGRGVSAKQTLPGD